MVFGPETFRRLVAPPFGEPPSVGSGREFAGFLMEPPEDAVRRGCLAFEQPEPAVMKKLAISASRRMRRMRLTFDTCGLNAHGRRGDET